jgi:hypothetical protein
MNVANIDNQIANTRENLRRLIEQATAYSGVADDALISERISANHPSAGDRFRRGLLPFFDNGKFCSDLNDPEGCT